MRGFLNYHQIMFFMVLKKGFIFSMKMIICLLDFVVKCAKKRSLTFNLKIK